MNAPLSIPIELRISVARGATIAETTLDEATDQAIAVVHERIVADDLLVDRLAKQFHRDYDQLRQDLRQLLRIPDGEHVEDDELVARIGTVMMCAAALADEIRHREAEAA